jgi:anti-sigma factor RsiW
MTQEQVKELLPAYALGVLSGEEAGQVGEALRQSPANQREFAAWQDVVAELAFASETLEPPAQLRPRLLSQIRQNKTIEPLPSRASNVVTMPPRQNLREVKAAPVAAKYNLWLALAACVALAALLGALFTVWRKNQSLQGENREIAEQLRLSNEALAAERARSETLLGADGRGVSLQGTHLAPKAHAYLSYNVKNGQASLAVNDLPPAPAGKSYQIWFINEAQAVPGPTFNSNGQGLAQISLQVPDNGLKAKTFAVTLETQDGAIAPTGEKYLLDADS